MSRFLRFYPKMGSMKTEKLLLLGGAGLLAYTLLKKKDDAPLTGGIVGDLGALGGAAGAYGADFWNFIGGLIKPAGPSDVPGTPNTLSSYATARPGTIPQTPAQLSARWDARNIPNTVVPSDIIQNILKGGNFVNSNNGLFTSIENYMAASTNANIQTQVPVMGAGTTQNAPPTAAQTAYAAQQAGYAAAAKGTPAYQGLYTPAYIASLPKTGIIGGGTAFQSGNGGYNTGIKYF